MARGKRSHSPLLSHAETLLVLTPSTPSMYPPPEIQPEHHYGEASYLRCKATLCEEGGGKRSSLCWEHLLLLHRREGLRLQIVNGKGAMWLQ